MNNVAFAVGTGRCGTNFLYKVLSMERGVKSTHERHPLSDSFHRFKTFYGLNIDDEGFLKIKEGGIKEDLKTMSLSFESSAYLSLSVERLYERFGAKFIFLVRSPEKVVNSYIQKGWYSSDLSRENSNLPPFFQPGMKLAHHSFSRLVPVGDVGLIWNDLSQVGKLAWYWNELNIKTLAQLKALPEDAYRIVRLEDLNYQKYLDICKFLGFDSGLSEAMYVKLSNSKPNRLFPVRTVGDWSEREKEEFKRHTALGCNEFSYIINWDKGGDKLHLKARNDGFRFIGKVKMKLINILARL